MNTLLENLSQMAYQTDLRLVFKALAGRQRQFDWLITDLDFIWLSAPPGQSCPLKWEEPQWFTGDELTALVETHDIQWVWAVLSGFPPGTHLDLQTLDVSPYADGNPMFWGEHPQIQHPFAQVEIVCWDSTSTLLLTQDDELTRLCRTFFPEAVDLDHHNRARNALR